MRCVSRLYNAQIDEIDHQIVALLRSDARSSFRTIGGRVGLSAPAVKRRVDKLQTNGVIRGYAAVVDPSAMGWSTDAFVEVYCDGRMSAAEVCAAVERHPEVTSAYTV